MCSSDLIDIHVDVPEVRFNELRGRSKAVSETSSSIRARVLHARKIQLSRFTDAGIFSNSAMSPAQISRYCRLDAQSESLLERAMTRQGLSARAHDRILKVARTIADMASAEEIGPMHISEAINYRSLDREA